MPILAAEPDCFPGGLLDPGAAADDGLAWWVAHTRPRQEKCLARRLYAARVPFYAPTAPRRVLVRGRVRLAHVPLFAGYVFYRGTADDRARVMTTRRAAGVLEVPDQDRLWADLRQVSRVVGTGRPVFPEDRIEPGVTVRVRSGPLAGLTGTVVRAGSGRRFVVRVDFIRRGVAVELDEVLLTRVGTC
jgi:transcription antitermination factor NusG